MCYNLIYGKLPNKIFCLHISINSATGDGVVVRASALQSVDQAFISQVESYQKTLKMFFTASLLGTKHKKDGVENKPASLHVVSLAKTLYQMPRSLCDKQVAEPGSLRVIAAQSK